MSTQEKQNQREATSAQMHQSSLIIHQQGLSFDQHNVLNNGGFLAATAQAARQGKLSEKGLLAFRQFLGIRARVIELGNGVTMTEPVILTIDYGRSWKVMKKAAGFDASNSNSNINPERFPIVGTGIVLVEASLFNFAEGTSSDNAESVIVKTSPQNPWATGKVEHIFAYGEALPNEQLEYPIVGLGSVADIDTSCHVVYLDGRSLGRMLRLFFRAELWSPLYRFLAFRTLPSGS